MSFSVNSDNDDRLFFDSQTYLAGSGSDRDVGNVCMDSVPLDNGKGISFNPMVEAKGLNGSISHFPIAAYDGFHNCRQFYNDPYPSTIGEGSDPSLSMSGALEAEEGSMSWNSGNLDASPQKVKSSAGATATAADNIVQGPVLMAGMTKAVHYVTSLFEDDDLEEDRSSSSASEVLSAHDENEGGEERQRENPRREQRTRDNNRNGNNHSKNGDCQEHKSPAEKARAAK